MSGYGRNQTGRRKTYRRVEVENVQLEIQLILAILARAGIDYLNGQKDAALFIHSRELDYYCEWIGVNADHLRARLRAQRSHHPGGVNPPEWNGLGVLPGRQM